MRFGYQVGRATFDSRWARVSPMGVTVFTRRWSCRPRMLKYSLTLFSAESSDKRKKSKNRIRPRSAKPSVNGEGSGDGFSHRKLGITYSDVHGGAAPKVGAAILGSSSGPRSGKRSDAEPEQDV